MEGGTTTSRHPRIARRSPRTPATLTAAGSRRPTCSRGSGQDPRRDPRPQRPLPSTSAHGSTSPTSTCREVTSITRSTAALAVPPLDAKDRKLAHERIVELFEVVGNDDPRSGSAPSPGDPALLTGIAERRSRACDRGDPARDHTTQSSGTHTAPSGGRVDTPDGAAPATASRSPRCRRVSHTRTANSSASEFSTSRQRAAIGSPRRNPSCGRPAKFTMHSSGRRSRS